MCDIVDSSLSEDEKCIRLTRYVVCIIREHVGAAHIVRLIVLPITTGMIPAVIENTIDPH